MPIKSNTPTMSDDSDKDNSSCPQSDRLTASIKVLSEIQNSLSISKDPSTVMNSLILLIRQSNGPLDTSFLGPCLVRVLLNFDIYTKLRALSALSIIVQPSSPILIDFVPLLINILDDKRLMQHAFKCFSIIIINKNLFGIFKNKLLQISEECGPYEKKLCLHLGYAAYVNDEREVGMVMKMVKSCLLDFKLSSTSIALEISKKFPELIIPICGILMGMMKNCEGYIYFKICSIFFNLLSYDKSFNEPLKSILSDPKLYDKAHIHSSVMLISKLENANDLVNSAGKMLEAIIKFTKTPEDCYILTYSFSLLKGKYSPKPDLFRRLANSNDPMIRAMVHEQLPQAPDHNRQIVGELISDKLVANSPFIVEKALSIAPKFGSWFVTLLFNLHDLKLTSTFTTIRNILTNLKDIPTKKLIISEVKLFWQELPDDDFGIALADLLIDISDDICDIYYLIPLNLTQRSTKFQDAMLDAVSEFIIHFNYVVEPGIINRFESLCSSHIREVRQRACELVYLINAISKNESSQ